MTRSAILLASCLVSLAAGCAQPSTDSLTFRRGVQILAAGSPRLAIPLFSQVISAIPDGPEPHAMLAMAYALDLRSEAACRQAVVSQSKRGSRSAPGWECVALGIADLTRRRTEQARQRFSALADDDRCQSGVRHAAAQWAVLAALVEGRCDLALDLLQKQRQAPQPERQITAMLWTVLVAARAQQRDPAVETLKALAARFVSPVVPPAGDPAYRSSAELRDAALRAMAKGDLPAARQALADLREKDPAPAEALLWDGLISAAQGDWSRACSELDRASRMGSRTVRGLARHLQTVAAAAEGDAGQTVAHLLAGQRLMSNPQTFGLQPTQAKGENVWMSHQLN